MSNELLLSQDGYDRLKAELEHLKSTERQRCAENIREAKSHGDLRENAMYHEAKLNQTRLEARIGELERILQFGKVVTRDQASHIAQLESRITVKDLEFQDEMLVVLVGAFDADPMNEKISVDSPLGKELLGKQAGDVIEVLTPSGIVTRYEVLVVE